MTKEQALHRFWSRFGIPAYDENSVPDDASLPYISYEVSIPSDFLQSASLSASLFYHDTSWEAISTKAEEIRALIGYGGHTENYTGGRLWVKRPTGTFAQRMAAEIDTVRRMVLNIEVDFLSE